MDKKALCIISGGMDSTVCAYLAKEQGFKVVALHFDYNQRTQNKERECFKQICKNLGVEKSYILDTSFIKDIGGNALTDTNLTIPKNELHLNNTSPITYVPFRNGIFLSIAGSLAEKEKCEAIFIGVIEEDNSGYPDCTTEFIKKAQEFINEGTSKNYKVEIITPLINLKKEQIISLALKKNIPLELTWSCYESENEACGECDSCLLRLKGFNNANLEDKIPYSNKIKHLKKLDENERKSLLEIWEKSVLATHHFLDEKNFNIIKDYLKNADLTELQFLFYYKNKKLVGFLGFHDDIIEMLFIDPQYFRQKCGEKLIKKALNDFNIQRVEVNKDNLNAIKFYKKMGFKGNKEYVDDFGYTLIKLELE
ncbi:7-cyano-7-deazaguanine synthase QueC [Campylobacter novaezeelandiae]|nr:7-cyano-7-deazaguanine synthase [Campylobacter novaezeelandiae]TBR79196.1 7-cyano-7-deazaguanine synthase QueC [Campylobacter novaezeelandiae]TBR81917.1 7-cyano-7-deazaguanine synthase QueC [Campylobacter novaezeelandiae]